MVFLHIESLPELVSRRKSNPCCVRHEGFSEFTGCLVRMGYSSKQQMLAMKPYPTLHPVHMSMYHSFQLIPNMVFSKESRMEGSTMTCTCP